MSSIDKVNVGGTIYDIKDSNVIDDTATSTDTTWSSSKINNELNGENSTTISLTLYDITNDFTVYKKGNHCYMNLYFGGVNPTATSGTLALGTLPNGYRPPHRKMQYAMLAVGTTSNTQWQPACIYVAESGLILLETNFLNITNYHSLVCYLDWTV